MKANIKYSFIVPMYNCQEFIEKTVESMAHQKTNQTYEIVLIDDGSTDSTLLICDKLKDKYDNIHIVKQDNSGAGPARNNGIINARGKYVIFVDSDDSVSNELISGVDKVCDNQDIIYYDYFHCYNDKKEIRSVIRTKNNIIKFNDVASPSIWSAAYRRNIFINNNLFFPPLKNSQDLAIAYKIAYYAKNIYHLNNPLYYYNANREGSLSTAKDERSLKCITDAIKSNLIFFSDKPQKKEIYESFINILFDQLILNGIRFSRKSYIDYYDEMKMLLETYYSNFIDWRKNDYFYKGSLLTIICRRIVRSKVGAVLIYDTKPVRKIIIKKALNV